MATAHYHFARAEELLAEVTNDDGSISFGDDCNGEIIAAAQVHATLAHAAALGAAEIPSVKLRPMTDAEAAAFEARLTAATRKKPPTADTAEG